MKKSEQRTRFIITLGFTIACVLILVPFIMIVSVSLSRESDISDFGYKILPMHTDLSAYKYLFKNPQSIINAYKVTFIFSTVSMFLSLLLMSMIAYPLTRKEMRGRGKISFYLYFTMLFSGGLVPTYILLTQYLHLNDTIWVYILPSLINPWYIFMIRTFFAGIPEEIVESAVLDGASEYKILAVMILPLSKPVLATVALFIFLGKWNCWYEAMLYINDDKLVSLQYLLQRVMNNIKLLQDSSVSNMSNLLSAEEIPSETVRMATAVLVAGPALFVFPFFQKYFVKGLTVGSVKG